MLLFVFGLTLGCADDSTGQESSKKETKETGFGEPTEMAEVEATYLVTFTSNWNETDHVSFPANAHFSPVVAVSHDENYHMFRLGEISSEAFEPLAELGVTNGVEEQLQVALANDFADVPVVTESLYPQRDGDTLEFRLTVTKQKPLITLATMIAPSPDWFVGLDSLNTLEEGTFITSQTVDLYALNAGTEEGDTAGNFSINNASTDPFEPIASFDNVPGLDIPFASVTIAKIEN